MTSLTTGLGLEQEFLLSLIDKLEID